VCVILPPGLVGVCIHTWWAEEKKDVSGSYHESCNVGGLGFVLVIPPTGKITRERKRVL
jgi:hypothetical protein